MIRKLLIWILGKFKRKPPFQKAKFFGDYFIEEAKIKDIYFIYSRIVEEAKSGHFNELLVNPELKNGLCFQAFCAINLRQMPNIQGSLCDAVLAIIRHKDAAIGFIWIRYFEESNDDGWELYLLSILPEHRGNNLGNLSVNYMLGLVDPSLNIYARLYKNIQNNSMKKILSNNGFKEDSLTNIYSNTLVYVKPANKSNS